MDTNSPLTPPPSVADSQALQDALSRLENSAAFRGHEDQLQLLRFLLEDACAELRKHSLQRP